MATKNSNQMVHEVLKWTAIRFFPFTHHLQARLNRLHENYPKRTVQALDKNAKRDESADNIRRVIPRVRTNIAIEIMNKATMNYFDYHSVLSLPSLGLPE